jgi:hypothetical protein
VTAIDKGLPSFLGNAVEGPASAVSTGTPTGAIPNAPSALQAVSITSDTITWQWTDNATDENGFRLTSSTGGVIADLGASPGTGLTVQFTETNLAVNTLYTRTVKAYNLAGDSLSSNTTARYTLARPATGTALTAAFISSATLTWGANGNTGGTTYEIQISTNAGFVAATSRYVVGLSSALQSLSSHTSYYFRIRSLNGESVPETSW